MFRKVMLAVACAVALPAAASATTYDFAADYGASVFSYGYGQGGSFTAYPNTFAGGCFGVANFACQSAASSSSQPFVGTTTNGAAFSVSTVDVPAGTLVFHPGPNSTNSDSILIFTAPVSTTYTLNSNILRLDNTPTGGNGVLLTAYLNGGPTGSAVLPNGAQYSSVPFSGVLFLNAGDTFQLDVGNNGEYTYDSTGLIGTISFDGGAVPEPATWGMMILGFGAVGATLRLRKSAARTAIA